MSFIIFRILSCNAMISSYHIIIQSCYEWFSASLVSCLFLTLTGVLTSVPRRGLNRTWQDRRIAWNKDTLFFARPNENKIIDSIPLSEVADVSAIAQTVGRKAKDEEKQIISNEGKKKNDGKESAFAALKITEAALTFTDSIGFPRGSGDNATEPSDDPVPVEIARKNSNMEGVVVKIRTIPNGFNSGRAYCLRTNRHDFGQNLCSDLTRKSKAARVRAEKLSKFQKNQAILRKFYYSNPFQMFMSSMILAVRARAMTSWFVC